MAARESETVPAMTRDAGAADHRRSGRRSGGCWPLWRSLCISCSVPFRPRRVRLGGIGAIDGASTMRQRRRALLAAILALGLCVLLGGRTDGADDDAPSPAPKPLEAELAAAYRIDVSDIDVTYDFWPSDPRVRGQRHPAVRDAVRAEPPAVPFQPPSSWARAGADDADLPRARREEARSL